MNPGAGQFKLPDGRSVRIERHPETATDLLPWAAADEYLLQALATYLGGAPGLEISQVEPGAGRPLVLGDSFGLLTLALAAAGHRPIHVSDSSLAQIAAQKNLLRNEIDPNAVTFIDLTQSPREITDAISLVVMRISKSVPRLKYEIGWVRSRLQPETKVITAGMTKHLSPNTQKILEEHWGETGTSRVYKKSVLFFVTPKKFELEESLVSSVSYTVEAGLEDPVILESFPGVFSQDRLDVGTRLLLESLPEIPPEATIVDLGCGNGVIALLLKLRESTLKVHAVEDSFLALSSAKLNFEFNGVAAESLQIADGLEPFEPDSVDWIVSNPPFHAATALNMEEAARHFRPAAKVLKQGGRLIVVGTHGIDYGPVLRQIFATVRVIGKSRRFRVFDCQGIRVRRREQFKPRPAPSS